MMPRLIACQLETSHSNPDGVGWYAYFDASLADDPSVGSEKWYEAVRVGMKEDGAAVGHQFLDKNEEVPNALSRHAGLHRYHVADGR